MAGDRVITVTGGGKSWAAKDPWRRWASMPAWQRHWLTYRKDYLMVLALIALYLIAIQVAQP